MDSARRDVWDMPRLYLAVCSAAAFVAGWITLGGMQGLNPADSLVPALVSLYRWSWFYWNQNRFGMLTPLLAIPIHHPLMHLLFQNWIIRFCWLMVFPLDHVYASRWSPKLLAGLASAGLFLPCDPCRGDSGRHRIVRVFVVPAPI